MPIRFTSVPMAWALSSASVAALAQPAPPPATAVSPLTVQAPPTPAVIRKQTFSFVQAYAAAPNPHVDQISRWREPVCVVVAGLPRDDQAAKIKARIESMAQAVGLRAAPADCRANVQIAFSDQPQGTIDEVARRQEPLLGYYHRARLNELKTITHPVQAWYATSTRATGGANIGSLGFSGTSTTAVNGSGSMGFNGTAVPSRVQAQADVIDDPQNSPPVGCLDRFSACYTSALYNVIIVADNKALAGKSLDLVADEMVMLALSQPRSQDGCNALPSVMDAFAKSACPGRDPPTGLTPADSAYLTALYASDAEAKKATEQNEIALRMAKILIKANTVDAAAAGAPPADGKGR